VPYQQCSAQDPLCLHYTLSLFLFQKERKEGNEDRVLGRIPPVKE
jgi:hypothetical protein